MKKFFEETLLIDVVLLCGLAEGHAREGGGEGLRVHLASSPWQHSIIDIIDIIDNRDINDIVNIKYCRY